jgi:glycerol-3-phosphate dehydrogenase (NAD(P)+)
VESRAPMRAAVLGGGSWGTALAKLLSESDHQTSMWVHNPAVCAEIREKQENTVYLPGFPLPASLTVTSDMAAALTGVEIVVYVSPSHVAREVLGQARQYLPAGVTVVSASKGVEEGTLERMSEVIRSALGRKDLSAVASLSGPSFAREVAGRMPTAVTAAAVRREVAEQVQRVFSAPTFRVYTSTDLVGVEVGGSVKNVIAIAAGVSDGLGFGSSTRAALITRGVAELSRLVTKLGGDPRTVAGLSGVGDLVLTCTGDLSRNRTVGLRLGKGEKLADILRDMRMVAEGVKNSHTVCELARRAGVEMPIAEQIRLLLHEDKPARQVVGDLMSRQAKPEIWE